MSEDGSGSIRTGAMYHIVRPWESQLFRQCRRAWDLSARERQDLEPVAPVRVFDFDEALHDALDVYYFPGMWDWDRAIVRPLAVKAFVKSMRAQRAAYAEHRDLSEVQQQEWERQVELGGAMLERYFRWAPQADRFDPLMVATQFDITIPPDPASPDEGLSASDGRGVWYRVRIDMVVADEHELYWLVEHRSVDGEWPDLDALLLDEPSLTRSWAWELGFLGKIEGTIHNELRRFPPGAGAGAAEEMQTRALDGPTGLIKQQSNEFFRRTQIPRSPAQLARRGLDVALQTREMTGPSPLLYPNPAPGHCTRCAYREPCLAMSLGVDAGPILETSYRKRTAEDFQPGRLGSVWGFVPEIYRVAEHGNQRQAGG